MEDSQGPWVFEKPYKHPKCKEYSGRIKNGAGKTVFSGYLASDEDGRRIVACVNACKGISTETLEKVRGNVSASVAQLDDMRKQRDELLAALKEAREAFQFANESPGGGVSDTIWMMHRPETLFDFMDAAIVKAEARHG